MSHGNGELVLAGIAKRLLPAIILLPANAIDLAPSNLSPPLSVIGILAGAYVNALIPFRYKVGRIPTTLRGVMFMPNVEKISIALPPEMVAQVRQAVDTGEYSSSSEVVREALRDWQRKRQLRQNGVAELRQLWQEAREYKSVGLDPDAVFDELERRYQFLAHPAGEAE